MTITEISQQWIPQAANFTSFDRFVAPKKGDRVFLVTLPAFSDYVLDAAPELRFSAREVQIESLGARKGTATDVGGAFLRHSIYRQSSYFIASREDVEAFAASFDVAAFWAEVSPKALAFRQQWLDRFELSAKPELVARSKAELEVLKRHVPGPCRIYWH